MDDFINKIKAISNLSELENTDKIDSNELIYAIIKSERYDLLENSNIRLNLSNDVTLKKLLDFLFSRFDCLYNIKNGSLNFTEEELDIIFKLAYKENNIDEFLRFFLKDDEAFDNFIKEHEQILLNYIKEDVHFSHFLLERDSFVELILRGDNVKLLSNIEEYSPSNLKLLVKFLKRNNNIPCDLANYKFAKHLFELKSNFEPSEFCELMNLFKYKTSYDINIKDSDSTSFSILVSDNIDYLIKMVSQTKTIPKCLLESSTFRDECIKRNRIDLAVKCILPPDIIQNETLVNAYCKELNINPKDFYERNKWLLSYHEKNNEIFNTFLGTSLKDNIFTLNEEHFERFINDVDVQISIEKLNEKELMILSKILNIYNYQEYDIPAMIVNIIENIKNYQQLINSINIETISEENLRKLVSVLQFSDNQYKINNIDTLQNYEKIKMHAFITGYNSNNLITNKNNLLKALFNIDISEAKLIDLKYCYDDENNSILGSLKNSELPNQVYDYLELIHKIIECNNPTTLFNLYNNFGTNNIYNNEIPLEIYIRSKYIELYSKSLYRLEEKNSVYGPKDSISEKINYNGKSIEVCIPREKFNFLIHCVSSDIIGENYKNDWLYRPQVRDHFVACSYINEKGIYSIRYTNRIIYGFDCLEGSSILAMEKFDIDSDGFYAKLYNSSKQFADGHSKFYLPDELSKAISRGYNEIVIERRNTNKSKGSNFKRKPDYIIMMVDSMAKENFSFFEDLCQNKLPFISDEDKKNNKNYRKK